MKWIKTLKFRLILTMMALVLLTILIISVSIVSNGRQAIEDNVRQDLTSFSELLVTNLLSSVLFDDAASASQILLSLHVRPDISKALLFDEQAVRFAAYQRPQADSKLNYSLVDRALKEKNPLLEKDSQGLHILMPMQSHGEVVGVLYLLDDLSPLKAQLNAFYRVVVVTAIIAFFASLLAMLWLVSLFTTPMNELLATMRDITMHKDYRRRAPLAVTEEFNQLSDSFNHMISEIERRGQQLEQANTELEARVKARTEALETALELANEANQAKAEFLAVMSHEVRTPLNGVIGFAELLKLYKLDHEAEETVQLLNDSAEALLALLNQILDFSKLDAEKVELENQRFEIGSFMKSVVETNRARADKKQLELTLNTHGCEGYFLGDPLRLRQILNNLIDNAIKFSDSGRVQVEVRSCLNEGQECLSFEVSDTGIGIAPAKLKSIFSPFAQADSSVTRKFGGTGLGLAICAQLITLMKGQYGVKSEQNQGSLFWFKIPLQRVETVSVQTEPLALPERDSAEEDSLILLAEDNEINQSVTTGMLKVLGYDVEIVSNGSEAVAHCMQRRYDLILMDYHMPVMGGIEATRQIRDSGEQGMNAKTPIVALTADIQRHVETKFRQAGANDLLIKPFTIEQFGQVVSRWLSATPAETTPEKPVIDESVLDEIRAMSGDQGHSLISHIVELYLQKTPALIEDIHFGVNQRDADKIFRAAHALKSSSANIGAVRVSEIARELEKLGRDAQVDHIHPHLAKLMESYEQVRVSLEGRLGEA